MAIIKVLNIYTIKSPEQVEFTDLQVWGHTDLIVETDLFTLINMNYDLNLLEKAEQF